MVWRYSCFLLGKIVNLFNKHMWSIINTCEISSKMNAYHQSPVFHFTYSTITFQVHVNYQRKWGKYFLSCVVPGTPGVPNHIEL